MGKVSTGKLSIGTSGWMYKDWASRFYPAGMKKGQLAFFAKHFSTVEINSSFYHVPLKSTFEKWTLEVPDDFVFAVKLSRVITHFKRLKGVRLSLEEFVKRAAPMQEKLGAILIQLPPSLVYEEELFAKFLEDIVVVSGRNYPVRFALEPRHKSWIAEENRERIIHQLRKAEIAFVFAQSKSMVSIPPDEEFITSDFIYLRFHGPEQFAASGYGAALLLPWAKKIRTWKKKGLDVFAYFNNDINGHALQDARTLISLLEKSAGKKNSRRE